MALGGGIWTAQNKVLPGTYVNFSSIARASASLSERGYAAMPLTLDWGPENQVFTVTNGDFQKNCLKIFGYYYTNDEMLPLRELFQYTQTLYAYRLNSGGVKATNKFATAKYAGSVGNKLSVAVAMNVDNESLFDVSTYYDNSLIETQTVADVSELLANDFILFNSETTLEATAKTPLTGGTNGTITAAAYQNFLDKIESYSFNTLGCPSDDTATIKLFVNFTKRMRDELGAKFQTVIYNIYGTTALADYEGVIAVGNKTTAESKNGFGQFGLIYWVTGVVSGCAINSSNTNKVYDGECMVDVDYTQAEFENAINTGRFMFHNVNGEVRILEDINSLVTLSDTKGEVFRYNQTIRVCDQIANDVAVLFNTRYLGTVPNDASGRISLWNDICKLHQELESIRAIENFDPDSIKVEQGDTKKSVLCTISNLNIINAMTQLYMSVIIL